MRPKNVLFFLLVVFLLQAGSSAKSQLRVDEESVSIRFGGSSQTNDIQFTVLNPGGAMSARVQLEWLDPRDGVRGRIDRSESLRPGRNRLSAKFPFDYSALAAKDRQELLWHRLRYRVAPEAQAAGIEPAEGVLSVGRVTPDAFTLHVAHEMGVRAGQPFRARVRALHPVSEQPVGGVRLSGLLTYETEDAEEARAKAEAVTDSSGYGVLEFAMPVRLYSEVEVEVAGRLGAFEDEVSFTGYLANHPRILLTTDKPIYQPGQALRFRMLAFDGGERAIADQLISLRIEDPENQLSFKAHLTTSRFGVAHAEWSIPENLRLGEYSITAELEDSPYDEEARAYKNVRISRYELPTFTVTVEPDRPYYLPEQNAEVTVRADYLFGKPLTRGSVRVVREEDRQWNYRKQKWETKDAEEYKREASDGAVRITIPLSAHHEEIADDHYDRFRDVEYAAYFTDASTGRTEQRRFALRVTREPIHVYLIQPSSPARDLPFHFYVSTSYADGTPAICDVVIREPQHTRAGSGRHEEPVYRDARTVSTNRYGLAKVTDMRLSWDEEDETTLQFAARDSRGRTGHAEENFWQHNLPVLYISTDKTLYRDGESIEVRLASDESQATVFVDVIAGEKAVTSRKVRLRNGQGILTLPWRPEYSGAVTLAGHFIAPSRDASKRHSFSYERLGSGQRTVLFPKPSALHLDVRWSREEYKPGEVANANLRVRIPGNRTAQTALGLVVFDKAVEERARTDSEFGLRPPRFGFYGDYADFLNEDQFGGIRRADLDALNMAEPLPDGMDLVAEVLLRESRRAVNIESSENARSVGEVYLPLAKAHTQGIVDALKRRYERSEEYPDSPAALRRFVAEAGSDFDSVRDPWGMLFEVRFRFERTNHMLDLMSAGPDKRPDTDDDFVVHSLFWPYFRPMGRLLAQVVGDYTRRSGSFVRDFATLEKEMRTRGIDLAALRDPWGMPYNFEFGITQGRFTISVRSAGPDREFTPAGKYGDDFTLETVTTDYFAALRQPVETALSSYLARAGRFFENEAEVGSALESAGLNQSKLRDPWGRPYYASLRTTARYTDKITVKSFADATRGRREEHVVIPTTQVFNWIHIQSSGLDGERGTGDDFAVASFRRLALERGGRIEIAAPSDTPLLAGIGAAIAGVVTDPTGALVPGTKVSATNQSTEKEFETETNEKGEYILRNLPPGFYRVAFVAAGFQTAVVVDVPVGASSVTRLNATLDLGTVSETVMVESEAVLVETANAMISVKKSLGTGPMGPASTPRLREYFPETLYWQPEIITDAQGRARIEFPLADNITTWRISALASTEDGKLGVFDGEIRAFQDFFVEHDPPRALTAGDQIALPVVLRNYKSTAQAVDVEMHSAPWFSLLGIAQQRVEVPAGESARPLFLFRADSPVKEGRQRITATGRSAGDAIEKPLVVRPDGNEIVVTAGQVFGEAAQFDLSIPGDAIPGATEAQLKIYPNLMAHVTESVEGILRRPYGCAEQTISSTYPSLLLLRYTAASGPDSPLLARARRYLRMGYERLLGYRAEGGGFAYWSRGEADYALTAYALRFLHDASTVMETDEELISSTRGWLAKQMQSDGSWRWRDWNGQAHPPRTLMQTAYVARILAAAMPAQSEKPRDAKSPQPTLDQALDFLAERVARMDEPYALASFALAAFDAGRIEAATAAVARLRQLARNEGGASYWTLETNTPFYGWGRAGRVETTALVLQSLIRANDPVDEGLVTRGTLFLLRAKDRYGVWYSTQATVQVLDTLMALISRARQSDGAERSAEVLVNGEVVASVPLPPANQLTGPVLLDLSAHIVAGNHRVDVRRPAGSSVASAQLVTSYYLPWRSPADAAQEQGKSDTLRLSVHFDKTEAHEGEEVRCAVSAERVGFRGYGMMIAEIGLPPGSEVDRASLERAKEQSGWGLSHYDVLPDRIVAYLWPRAGGMKFEFSFTLRYGMTAKAAPSQLYDYYNPEARVVVAPALFHIDAATMARSK